ncbi:hypothetical protein NJ959_00500 [Symplocastrum sp. BBK-W-15]|uniref:Uncharacterized protein n=1 Tax=Limnofasciculus baicalensis BBK-W-15 TaxID=2699891 RepID=A0AAE3GN62_9CYAN|nr:hypothetical protein [Limnofasciculus baicalensis BBK-W-15]
MVSRTSASAQSSRRAVEAEWGSMKASSFSLHLAIAILGRLAQNRDVVVLCESILDSIFLPPNQTYPQSAAGNGF